jgi:diguanylate cyclase
MYTDKIGRAGEYLRLALTHISKYNLPVNPVNYTVWYEYVSGKNRELKKAIDHSLKTEAGFSRNRVETLYEKHITGADRITVSRILVRMALMLRNIISHVALTSDDLSGHGKSLEKLAAQIHIARDDDKIKHLIRQMVSETRALVDSGKRLQTRMKISSGDLEQLQKEIDKSRMEARTDALTGLLNRRGLESRLKTEQIRARNTQTPFSIILTDIDHFKKVNDTFGHLVGDNLLKILGRLLKSHLRKNDTAARYGGEEFLLILSGTGLRDAVAVGEKIRRSMTLKEWKIKRNNTQMGKITVSMGIAAYRPGDTVKALVERADEALYRAKNNGRDRIEIETVPD